MKRDPFEGSNPSTDDRMEVDTGRRLLRRFRALFFTLKYRWRLYMVTPGAAFYRCGHFPPPRARVDSYVRSHPHGHRYIHGLQRGGGGGGGGGVSAVPYVCRNGLELLSRRQLQL